MQVFTPEFINTLSVKNKQDREKRHPQFAEIHGLMNRMEGLYKEIELETQRRVQSGVAVSLKTN